ncbi:MAG: hypothetical protein PHR39_01035 [Actinomycetota bacterium]|nr:hypothetical protein [Actinomycetota bacterium]
MAKVLGRLFNDKKIGPIEFTKNNIARVKKKKINKNKKVNLNY